MIGEYLLLTYAPRVFIALLVFAAMYEPIRMYWGAFISLVMFAWVLQEFVTMSRESKLIWFLVTVIAVIMIDYEPVVKCWENYETHPETNPLTLKTFMSTDPNVTANLVWCFPLLKPIW